MFTSDLFRFKAATPKRRTDSANILSVLREAAGLELCFLASPAGRIPKRALLWFDILSRIWGRLLLSEDLTIPTCSATGEKSILVPQMLIVLISSR